jgi:hypothetical protein
VVFVADNVTLSTSVSSPKLPPIATHLSFIIQSWYKRPFSGHSYRGFDCIPPHEIIRTANMISVYNFRAIFSLWREINSRFPPFSIAKNVRVAYSMSELGLHSRLILLCMCCRRFGSTCYIHFQCRSVLG